MAVEVGIGRRHDGGHDAKRLRDLDDPAVLVPRDDADRLHRTDEGVDLLGAEEVLLNLVFDDAVAGFLDGEPRERFSLRRRGGGHRVHDRVDALLTELGQFEPRLFGAAGQRASLGNGGEVAIGLSRARGFGHR